MSPPVQRPLPEHINDYPPERHYAKEAVGLSVGAHVLFVIIVAIIALIFHVKSLRDLMLQGGSIEMHAPPPEEHIEVFLKDELPPPPPIPTPEFVRQIVKPPPPPPKPIEKPKPKPQPTPAPVAVARPEMESRLVVGTTGLPHPGYPIRAKLMHISGTVEISVTFDSTGKAVSADVVSSSGSGMLDEPTRSFILENWHNESFAGRTETVPVEYNLGQ